MVMTNLHKSGSSLSKRMALLLVLFVLSASSIRNVESFSVANNNNNNNNNAAAASSQQQQQQSPRTTNAAKRVFVSTPSKPNARKVSDCMSTILHTLSPTMSVDEGISQLLKYGYSGAPVVDDTTQELIGMVSAFDFLQKEAGGALLPMEGSIKDIEVYIDAAKRIVATSVNDLMTSNRIVTVSPNDTMRDAALIMQKERLHRLPVVDTTTGKLVGMLSSSDVMLDVLTKVQMALPERSTTTTGTSMSIDNNNNENDDNNNVSP